MIDNPDNRAGKIKIFLIIQPRHLCRFTTDKGAPVFAAGIHHTGNHSCSISWRQLSTGIVIEKEKRLCAADENIIRAVIDKA